MRDAPSLSVIAALQDAVPASAPMIPRASSRQGRCSPKLEFAESPYAAAEGADALVIVTEWDEFSRRSTWRAWRRSSRSPC
ncbi:MAG: UDP binding domain-containing protein [Sphingomonas sp.]